jgi:hypothetical protein
MIQLALLLIGAIVLVGLVFALGAWINDRYG